MNSKKLLEAVSRLNKKNIVSLKSHPHLRKSVANSLESIEKQKSKRTLSSGKNLKQQSSHIIISKFDPPAQKNKPTKKSAQLESLS